VIKTVVQEAKQRNMRVWVDDDGGYPSGFAGGKFTIERPDLRMKALDRAEQIPVTTGQAFARPWMKPSLAHRRLIKIRILASLEAKNGQINWTVPPAIGRW